MFRTFFINLKCSRAFGLCGVLLAFCLGQSVGHAIEKKPLSKFQHPSHTEIFKKFNIQCVDCHEFGVKPVLPGPLASPIPAGLLHPPRAVCHQCHVEKVSFPRPNQCLLCHERPEKIQPADHLLGWKQRHGRMAQMNRDSCTQCHSQRSCDQCHLRLDSMNPNVHPGNFKLFHSVQARSNPQSCVQCHRSPGFCVDCHTGRRSQ